MSSFSTAVALRVLKFSAHALRGPGQDCLLCLAPSGDRIVCGPCEASLPRLGACCIGCAVPLAFDGWCGACQRRPPRFDAATCVFEYRFPVDRLVHRFKYSGDLALGRWLAMQLAARVRSAPRPDLIVAGARLQPGARAREGRRAIARRSRRRRRRRAHARHATAAGLAPAAAARQPARRISLRNAAIGRACRRGRRRDHDGRDRGRARRRAPRGGRRPRERLGRRSNAGSRGLTCSTSFSSAPRSRPTPAM